MVPVFSAVTVGLNSRILPANLSSSNHRCLHTKNAHVDVDMTGLRKCNNIVHPLEGNHVSIFLLNLVRSLSLPLMWFRAG